MRRVWPASNVFSFSETASPLNKENPSTRGSPTPLPHSQPRRAVPTHRRHGRAAPGLAAPAASGRDGTEGLIPPPSDNQNTHKVSLFFSHLLPRCIFFLLSLWLFLNRTSGGVRVRATAGYRSGAYSGTPRLFLAAPVQGSRERLCWAEPGSALQRVTGKRGKGERRKKKH